MMKKVNKRNVKIYLTYWFCFDILAKKTPGGESMNNKRNLKLAALVITLGLIVFCTANPSASVKKDEELIFFNTSAHLDQDGEHWVVPIYGWIFEREANSLKRNALLKSLRAIFASGESDAAKNRFEERLRMFVVDNESKKKIRIDINGSTFETERSKDWGHFSGIAKVKINNNQLATGSISFKALEVKGNRTFTGTCFIVKPEGVSVISDIDDTIKDSQVLDKKETLKRTFLKEFIPIPGMPDAYNTWKQKGASFHYVSSSPWQLYPSLMEFFKAENFPPGCIHLKVVELDSKNLFNLLKSSVKTKPPIIRNIISKYPHRKFILVGDSGEHDPEVYGIIAREMKANGKLDHLLHIFIRNVTPDKDPAVYEQAFEGIPKEKWTVFDDPAVLKNLRIE
jgi:phosphatidate phosphatase APP1